MSGRQSIPSCHPSSGYRQSHCLSLRSQYRQHLSDGDLPAGQLLSSRQSVHLPPLSSRRCDLPKTQSQRPVRRFFISSSTRWDDGLPRYGQQPYGRCNCCYCSSYPAEFRKIRQTSTAPNKKSRQWVVRSSTTHRRDFCRVLYLQPYFAKLAMN